MAILFVDGFDHYATTDIALKWDSLQGSNTSLTTIASTSGRNGKGALSARQGQVYKLVTRGNDFFFGFSVKMPSTNHGTIAQVLDSVTSTSFLSLIWNSDNTISIKNPNSGTVLGTTSSAYSVDSWDYFDWRVQVSSSTGTSKNVLRINGAVVITLASGLDTHWGSATSANELAIGSFSGALDAFTVLFDDVVLYDTSGTINNDFIGDVVVEATYPDGQGNSSSFSVTGAATHYGAVNEHPEDGDTSYVYTTNPLVRESFTFTDVSDAILNVKAVQPVMVARKNGAGVRAVCPFFRQGGTNYDQTAQNLGDSYSMIHAIFELNPATSAAFTDTEITGIEAGIKVTQ